MKKTIPAKKISRLIIEKLVPEPPLLVSKSERVPSGFILGTSFWLTGFRVSITLMF